MYDSHIHKAVQRYEVFDVIELILDTLKSCSVKTPSNKNLIFY